MVLKMEEDSQIPLILGRKLLAMVGTILNFKLGKLAFNVDILFSSLHTSICIRLKVSLALSRFLMNGVFVIFPNKQYLYVSNDSYKLLHL